MEMAFAWIGEIAAWIGQFIPRRVVLDTTEGAVKWVTDYDPKFMPPGTAFWWWPWTSKAEVFPVVRQTDSIEAQTMETKDGVTFMATGTLTYEVTDLLKLMTTVHSPVTAINEMACSAMNDTLPKMTWSEIQSGQQGGTLKTKLKGAASKELSDVGVNVIRFKLNTLARCRVLKVSQSTASEER